ncbi:ubiquitin-associated protein 1-like isoform X3 [Brienomyrus brachyistius]|uniref:ubiquitin-associated protein 1-like isoform X3 n=1 Tax=Brienomyrus brachyistius TaxID=42636 RepID=UPI0020B382C0|nr:ubiquitin-associated protein 1-like isoform X3 [Brienomyrus brachyistius]
MSSLGDIPFKIPSVSRETPQPVMAPEFPIPDFLRLMWETEYDFHLENWVLAGLVGGSPRHPEVQQPDAPLEFTSSCPPHWLMFSGGPAPCLGSLSLNPKVTTGSLPPKVKFAVSVSDGNRDSCSEDVEGSSNEDPTMTLPTSGPVPVPSLSDNHCLGQSSLPRGVAQHSATHWHLSRPLCLGSPGPCASSTSRDLAPSSTVQTSRLEQHQTAVQVLRYLLSCDRLCELGHDMAEVQEALEMFQNCETKAAEFLHLLAQFDEMGFQQNTIKEVLLVHENHRERALEELMMRAA